MSNNPESKVPTMTSERLKQIADWFNDPRVMNLTPRCRSYARELIEALALSDALLSQRIRERIGKLQRAQHLASLPDEVQVVIDELERLLKEPPTPDMYKTQAPYQPPNGG